MIATTPKRKYKPLPEQTLDPDDVMKCARIAASKYFSTDQSLDKEDLAMIAARRILERGPTTLGTAVHVGREGIMREVGYRRYENATNTIQFSVAESDDRPIDKIDMSELKPSTSTEAGYKYLAFVQKLAIEMGEPHAMIPKYGIAYRADVVSETLINQFESPVQLDRDKHLIRCDEITEDIAELARTAYVLAVINVPGFTRQQRMF